MNAPARPQAQGGLFPGVSFFQVLTPGKILAANGDIAYEMHGPFGDLGQASAFCQTRPGSLITVTLVLFQAPAVSVPLQPKPQ